MRKKIGKRIGPVPITLAVFALAAVLSVGLLVLAPGGNVTHAQGDAGGVTLPTPAADKCEVTVVTGPNGDKDDATGKVSGGGCMVSGDSVDVVFKNAGDEKQAVAVYTTGGDEYNVQAVDSALVRDLGKKGVNEDLFDIDAVGTKVGGGSAPGSETVTVSRDMADDKGEVYLFVYHADDAGNPPKTFADAGIPFSFLSGATTGDGAVRKFNDKTVDTLDTLEEEMVKAVEDARGQAVETPAVIKGGVGLDQDVYPNFKALTKDHDDFDAGMNDMTRDEATLVANAKTLIQAIMDDPQYADPGKTGDDDNTLTILKANVAIANTAIARLDNVVGLVAGTTGSVNSFYGTTADISVQVVFRFTATRGTDADRDGAINGTEERSTLKVARPPSKTNGEAAIEAIIEDENETRLAGFVDFTIEGDAEVLFKASSLKTHRVALGVAPAAAGSTGQVEVKGLSKTEPVRVKVTANYNNGELIQTVYLSRLGDAMEVEATAYSCRANEDDTDATVVALSGLACDYEIMSLTADKIVGNDPKELVSIGAGDYFFIAGTAKDALGSTVDSLSSGKVTWKAADAEARAVFVPTSSNTNTEIMIKSDADPGTYNITVEDSGKDASATVMVTVAGDASMISVSCDPEMIPTETGLTDCTVMVRDAADNIPSNLDTEIVGSPEQDQVQISVRGSSDIKADLIGPINNLINLDEQGMANFAIQMPLDAVEGTRITVNVSASIDDELLRNHTVVTYGDPSTDPGTIDPGTMDELTAPMNVDASYVPLTGSISMNWTEGQGANRQMVVLLGSGSAVVYNMTVTADTSVHDIRTGNDGEALMPGEYRLFVLSISGSNFEPSAAFAITVPAN